MDDFAGDASTTGILEVDGTAMGSIEVQGDVDFFAIELTAGELVRISAPDEVFNLQLTLQDELGNVLSFGDNDFNTLNSFVLADVEVSGTYFVSVEGFDPIDYTLSAEVIVDDFAGDTSTTGVLEIDGTAMGSIEVQGDVDFFAIELTAGELVRISAPDDFFSLGLSLQDELGNVVAFGNNDFNTFEAFILADVEASGTYFVSVESFGFSTDYTLSAEVIADDFAGNTSTIGVLEIDGSVMGSLEVQGDVDFFAIELTAGDLVRISAPDDFFSLGLSLQDELGNIVSFGNNNDNNTGEAFILADVEVSGTYFVSVESFDSVDYTLSAEVIVDDFAGNTSTTGVLAIDGSVMGSIEVQGDVDFFAIELTAGELVRISAPDDFFSLGLSLQDELGNVVSFGNNDFNTGDAFVLADVEASGTYYVSVGSFDSVDYTLSAEVIVDDFAGDTSTTGLLELGGSVMGSLEIQGDVDFFAIELTAGELVRISAPDDFFSLQLSLQDDLGNVVSFGDSDFNTGDAFVLADVEASGTYFVSVGSFDSVDYTLSAEVIVDDFAGNTSTTGVLEIDGTAMGSLDFQGDVDFFAIELTAGELVRISAPDDFFSLGLSLQDELGNVVSFGNNDFNTGEAFVLADVEVSGTYFVSVESFDSVDYTLSAEVIIDDFAGDTSTTGLLELGGTAMGALEFGGDVDFFAIDVAAGDIIRISTFDLNFSSNFNLAFNLRSSDGAVFSIDNFDFDTNEAFIEVEIDIGGTYFVSVESLETGSLSSNIDYTLSAALIGNRLTGLPGDDVLEGGAGDDIISGLAGQDTLIGGAGDDTIIGGADDDLLNGDNGNDALNGESGDDTLNGGAGEDVLLGASGDDTLNGGADNDDIDGGGGNDTINGGTGDDILSGSIGEDVINGGAGADTLNGGNQNDMLFGGSEDDVVSGGGGSDYLYGGAGDDVLIGEEIIPDEIVLLGEVEETTVNDVPGTAVQHINFTVAVDGIVTIDILSRNFDIDEDGTFSNLDSQIRVFTVDETSPDGLGVNLAQNDDSSPGLDGSTSSLDSFLSVSLTAGHYVLTVGNFSTSEQEAREGFSQGFLSGDGAFQATFTGVSFVEGSVANPQINNANDTLFGGSGEDMLIGGDGDDILNGGTDNDVLNGGTDNDTLNGQSGNDLLIGGDGDDILLGASGDDTLNGGADNDDVNGGGGNDTINGGAGDDILFGSIGEDVINGGAGNDTINGGSQNDMLLGASGNDALTGGGGNDSLDGGGGNDALAGGAGADTLIGGAGADVLEGNAGGDDLFGGNGSDILFGGGGNDDLYGEAGADTFVFTAAIGVDRIKDFEDGIDAIDLSGFVLGNDFADVMDAATQVGANVRLDFNANNSIIIEGFNLADLDETDFIFEDAGLI